MTLLTPDPPSVPTPYLDLTGDAGYIAGKVDAYLKKGQLERFDTPVSLPDGTYSVRVYLRPTPAVPVVPTRPSTGDIEPHRWDALDYLSVGGPVARTGLVTGVVATTGWGTYTVATAVAQHAEQILPAAAVAVVFWVITTLGAVGTACAGLHCAGCRG